MAKRLVARLTEAGHPTEAHFFEGEGHVFRAVARNREWELLVDFFTRHLDSAMPTTKGG
jgi:dipeptidyl aminopeptidase/acylaminoacyl peptidase